MDEIPLLFIDQRSKGFSLNLLFVFILLGLDLLCPTYGYDPLDPNGNITIKWDVLQDNGDTQDVRVSILNYQLFRHIDPPGWTLRWEWTRNEVIWEMWGAETTQQGNCSSFSGKQQPLPHCCDKEPVIIDLLPRAPYNKQVSNCCKGGVLSSISQDPQKYVSSFQMNIASSSSSSNPTIPANFTLGLPGYSCGNPLQVPPSKFFEDNGRRQTQALATWNVTCTYSQYRVSAAPTCCVSLSAFYNDTIVPCPTCSCGCRGQPGGMCLRAGEQPPVLQLEQNQAPQPVVQCSRHMCPIKVHWHVKVSYTQYWRVKITITNLNHVKNYSQWSLVVLHPNLNNVTQVFSFNYKPLNQFGYVNDTGMFFGIQYYNDMLLQSGESGNVQTEMLLHKDPSVFTFRDGWAFPRRISFNGDECVMPPPDNYPRLPNSGWFNPPAAVAPTLFLISFLVVIILHH